MQIPAANLFITRGNSVKLHMKIGSVEIFGKICHNLCCSMISLWFYSSPDTSPRSNFNKVQVIPLLIKYFFLSLCCNWKLFTSHMYALTAGKCENLFYIRTFFTNPNWRKNLSESAFPLAWLMEIALTLVAQAVLMNERKGEFPFFPLEEDNSCITSKHLSAFSANEALVPRE